MKALTYDDLANMYHKQTGRAARIKPMRFIVDWALSKPDLIRYNKKKDLFFKNVQIEE